MNKSSQLTRDSKGFFDKKPLRMFSLCLLLSVGFWLVIKLSRTYIDEVEYEINYTNIPLNKVFYALPDHKLFIRVRANGFLLLRNKLIKNKLPIDVRKVIRKQKEEYVWRPSEHFNELAKKINHLDIIEIRSQTPILPLRLSNLTSKKVPIIINEKIKYKRGFKKKKLVLGPTSLEIAGPEKKIRELDHIDSQKWTQERVDSDLHEVLDLKLPEGIRVSHSKVKVHLLVEPYTEKTISVPIKTINAPENVQFSPEMVKLVFKVGYDKYNEADPSDFLVLCDFSVLNNFANQLPLTLKSVPSFLDRKDILMYPDKVRVLVLDH